MASRRPKNLEQYIAEQRHWIERCGGNLSGYVARYGSASQPGHSGDGGEAIYAADIARLQQLISLRQESK